MIDNAKDLPRLQSIINNECTNQLIPIHEINNPEVPLVRKAKRSIDQINKDTGEIIKTFDFYNSKYKECLIKINNAIELNLIEIIYSVENSYFGYQTYNSDECIKYIDKK